MAVKYKAKVRHHKTKVKASNSKVKAKDLTGKAKVITNDKSKAVCNHRRFRFHDSMYNAAGDRSVTEA